MVIEEIVESFDACIGDMVEVTSRDTIIALTDNQTLSLITSQQLGCISEI